MIPFDLAVVSHRRSDIFEEQTLAYLEQTDVDLSRLTLFLSDGKDMEDYNKFPFKKVQTDVANVRDKFNFVHEYYEPGTRVFLMEDDIKKIIDMKRQLVVSLHGLIQKGFKRVGDEGIFGLVPHDMILMFKPRITFTLKLVVAHAFGFVATRDPDLAVQSHSKTDYERTCRYYEKYGKIVRLDMFGIRTKSYNQRGGMSVQVTDDERADLEADSCDYIVDMWPDLVDYFDKKSSPYQELRFKRLKR